MEKIQLSSQNPNIAHLDWAEIAAQLDLEGYALLPGHLSADMARILANQTEMMCASKRSPLESSGLGSGEMFYFGATLPAPFEDWRTEFYRNLAAIANRWNVILDIDSRYPAELRDFLERNRQAGQVKAQSHLASLGAGDHVNLHQSSEGRHVFPMQVVALLSEPIVDFTGGEFVMTEQRPRMQSRPMVLPLTLGDVAIISTSVRPFKGTKGHYRVNMKHAISHVRQGKRIGMELTFHDAP